MTTLAPSPEVPDPFPFAFVEQLHDHLELALAQIESANEHRPHDELRSTCLEHLEVGLSITEDLLRVHHTHLQAA